MAENSHHSGAKSDIVPSRSHRGARFIAASAAIAGLVATPVLLTVSTGTVFAQQETPAQRCARETATYNQAMESAWRAANPGKTPPAGAWPAYICQELPGVELPPGGGNSTGGNSTGSGSGNNAPGRDHRYQGPDHTNVYRQDMGVGAPRTGLSDRMGGSTTTTAPRATDTARSNVPVVPAWATPRNITVTDSKGESRQVRVIDTDAGVAVITDDGVATGEIVTNTDRDSKGTPSTRDVEGLEGVNLFDQLEEINTPADEEDNQATSPVGPGPLGAIAAAAGGIGVLTNNRRRHTNRSTSRGTNRSAIRPAGFTPSPRPGGSPSRPTTPRVTAPALTTPELSGIPGLDSAPRVTINHLNGAEQTIFALLSPQSDHTQEFDLDVPDGGDAIIRPDGGVDIVDAQGNIVSQVDPPWAYDALGRLQNTWYTYNPDTGRLTQHVEPNANALYPIIADPSQRRAFTSEDEDLSNPPNAPDGYHYEPVLMCTEEFPLGYWQLTPDSPPKPEKPASSGNASTPAPAQETVPAPSNSGSGSGTSPSSNEGHSRPDQIAFTSSSPNLSNPPVAPDGYHYEAVSVCTEEYPLGYWQLTPNGPGGVGNASPGTSSGTEYGDTVSRDSSGQVQAHNIDGVQPQTFNDGSSQVNSNDGSQTRYFPLPKPGEYGGEFWIASVHYDPATNQTTMTVTDGEETHRITQSGRPDYAGPASGTPESQGALAPISTAAPNTIAAAMANPTEDVPVARGRVNSQGDVVDGYINPAEQAVFQPETNTVDIYPEGGGTPLTIDAGTGVVLQLGTTYQPQQGPFTPQQIHPITGQLVDTPINPNTGAYDPSLLYNDPALINGPGAGDIFISAIAGAAQAANSVNDTGGGAHRATTAGERAGQGFRNSMVARRIAGVGYIVTATQSANGLINDPGNWGQHVGNGVGTVGGGIAGAWVGGFIGAFGGPLAPLTVPLGGAIGGAIGGYLGGEAGTTAGQGAQSTIEDRF